MSMRDRPNVLTELVDERTRGKGKRAYVRRASTGG